MPQQVIPTRMEMLKLRRRLVVAKRGHKLLKDKLDGLMKDFGAYAKAYREARQEVDAQLPPILKGFVLAQATSSRTITEDALENASRELDIQVKFRRIMSVSAPELHPRIGEFAGGYSRIHTSPELDAAIAGLTDFVEKILRMAQLEQTVRLLCAEIEKTRRRVNALEHTIIPRTASTIAYIKNRLDEQERSNISRLMKIKEQRLRQEEAR